jgi:hypothetical protein
MCSVAGNVGQSLFEPLAGQLLRPWRRRFALAPLVAILLGVFSATQALGQPPTRTETIQIVRLIDIPNATFASPMSINSAGRVVGWYSTDGGQHGWLLDGEILVTRETPGLSIRFVAITDADQILGIVNDGDGGGVVMWPDMSVSSYIPVFGNCGSTFANAMNVLGTIVGAFCDNGRFRGFIMEAGGLPVPLDIVGATQTVPTSINAAGVTAGWFTNGTGEHGFVFIDGEFTQFDIPGATSLRPSALTSSGAVVGSFYKNGWHGFVLDGATVVQLDAPNAVSTIVNGINDYGVVVGYLGNGTGSHGFVGIVGCSGLAPDTDKDYVDAVIDGTFFSDKPKSASSQFVCQSFYPSRNFARRSDGKVTSGVTFDGLSGDGVTAIRQDPVLPAIGGPVGQRNYSPGRNMPVDAIVFHYCGGSFASCIDEFNTSPAAGKSAHYIVSRAGTIVQTVRNADTAFHATYYNARSIGIEIEGSGLQADLTDAVYESLAQLTAQLLIAYEDVPIVHPTGEATVEACLDSPGLVGHFQVQPQNTSSCLSDDVQHTFEGKVDPGPHFDWDRLLLRVGELLSHGIGERPLVSVMEGESATDVFLTAEGGAFEVPATVIGCGYVHHLTSGTSIAVDCGSLNLKVLEGFVRLPLGRHWVLEVPAGGVIELREIATGLVDVLNAGTSTVMISLRFDGLEMPSLPPNSVRRVNYEAFDIVPPTLALPDAIVAEATSPSGAVVNYVTSATDDQDGNVPISCAPLSGETFAIQTSRVQCRAVDSAGNGISGEFAITVRDTIAPVVTAPADLTVTQNLAGGAMVTYSNSTVVENGSGLASLSCAPTSGTLFPVGTTTVSCIATDVAGLTGSDSFKITVVPAAPDLDGRMFGHGHVHDLAGKHHHFAFRVAERGDREWGRLEYWANEPRQCSADDDHPRHGGEHDGAYGRSHRGSRSRFEATAVDDVVFSNDPDFSPFRRGPRSGQQVDSVTFTGRGTWNSKSGYTFEATATDQGEPGKDRDTFSLVIRDAKGNVVANVGGGLGGGNVESMTAHVRRNRQ